MHQKNFFMYAPMYTTKFVGSFPIHWVVADVSISFRNLQISLKSSNWYKQINKINLFILCIMLQPWWALLVVEAVIEVLLNI